MLNKLLLTSFPVIISGLALTSSLKAIPKPPEMHPLAKTVILNNPRLVVTESFDDGEFDLEVSAEMNLGKNECWAKNNSAFISVGRPKDGIVEVKGIVINVFVGKGKCGDEDVPQIVTVRKTVTIKKNTNFLNILNFQQENVEQLIPVRSNFISHSEIRFSDIQKIKTLENGNGIWEITGEVFTGFNECLTKKDIAYLEVKRGVDDSLNVIPMVYIDRQPSDETCDLVLKYIWKPVSIFVEASSLDKINLLYRDRTDFDGEPL